MWLIEIVGEAQHVSLASTRYPPIGRFHPLTITTLSSPSPVPNRDFALLFPCDNHRYH